MSASASRSAEIGRILDRCDDAIAAGSFDLGPIGFWKAVGMVKRDPDLVDRYADRIASIDRRAFGGWALVSVPVLPGTIAMGIGATIALVLVSVGYYVDAPWNGLFMLAGMGVALLTTHGLGHQFAGLAAGIRFTHWYVGSLSRPQPGIKIDYASYLRASARSRAWMHAAGAIVTKLVPFLVLGSAITAAVPGWATTTIVVVAIGQIITDATLSINHGDWKKFRREMRLARAN